MSGSFTGTWTAQLYQSIDNGLNYTPVAGTAVTGSATTGGTITAPLYTTPTTSYYYRVQVSGGNISPSVTGTSLYFFSAYQGPQGVQGNPGVQGTPGVQGNQGPQGIQGVQGIVAINNYAAQYQLVTTAADTTHLNAAGTGLTWNGSTLNVTGNVTASSINNGNSTFTITSTTGTNSNTLTVGAGNGTGNAIYTTGTILASDVTASSDRRMKSDIATISNALEIVKNMRGVYFTRLGQSSRSVGVIAQEVEEVLPEVVHTGSDDMKSVSYGNIVGLLIEAVKELAEKMEK